MANANPTGATAALSGMLNNLDSFQHVLRDGARQKREKEEQRVTQLRVQLVDVERAVAEESTRRSEAAKALRSWAETQVSAMRIRLEDLIEEKTLATNKRIDEIHERITELEKKFAQDKIETIATVQAKNEELLASLEAFRTIFEEERVARLAREQVLLEKLGNAEHEAQARWDAERSHREKVYMEIKQEIAEGLETREKLDAKFQSKVLDAIAKLKQEVAEETKTRETEDEQLAASLATYVQKLQASLVLITSGDTV